MVAKLLGDATYFPIEFRRWLKDFIENSDIKISSSQIIGGTGSGGGSANPTLLPAGIILPFATTLISKDVLPCNGAAVSKTDYKELFDAIGGTWGAITATTFTVPDLRDRALYGMGSVISLGGTDGKSLGNRGGPSHRHSLSGNTNATGGNHTHGFSGSVSIGAHTHQVNGGSYALGVRGSSMLSGTGGASSFGPDFNQTDSGGGGSSGFSGTTGQGSGDHSHSLNGMFTSGDNNNPDKPSFAGVQYVITLGRTPAS